MPAAGVGKRMAQNLPKQYLRLDGKSIIEHSLSRLLNLDRVSGVVVGIAETDQYWSKLAVNHDKLLGIYSGGNERIHTVLKGLEYLSQWAQPEDWVMVHDAVRPCVSEVDITALIDRGLASKGGAILAARVVDTIKKVNTDGFIESTANRDELMLAMTPQLFPLNLLSRALRDALEKNKLATDEAGAVEEFGEQPVVVEGLRNNIKITTSEDLELARVVLKQQRSQEQ